MDDQIQPTIGGPVDFDEVVAPAQGAQRALEPPGVLQRPETAERFQIKGLLAPFPHVHARGNEVSGFVKPGEIHRGFVQMEGVHAAADVNAHHVGHGLVSNGHGGADGAALARVHVRHDANGAARCAIVIAHAANLVDGLLLDDACVCDGRSDLSLNNHVPPPGISIK